MSTRCKLNPNVRTARTARSAFVKAGGSIQVNIKNTPLAAAIMADLDMVRKNPALTADEKNALFVMGAHKIKELTK